MEKQNKEIKYPILVSNRAILTILHYLLMAFDRTAIIHSLYTSPEVNAAISKMQPVELQEDLKQEMFLVLCNLPEERLRDMWEKQYIKWFLVRTMTNMIQSDRSSFYNTHRKHSLTISRSITTDGTLDYINDLPHAMTDTGSEVYQPYKSPESLVHHDERNIEWHETVTEAVADLDPYEAELIKLYAEMGGSCKPVAIATKISERGVRFAVAKAREKLQKKLRA